MSEIWIIEPAVQDWRNLLKPVSTERLFQTVLRGGSIDAYYESEPERNQGALDSLNRVQPVVSQTSS